jgi:hypothetical protein
MTAPFADGGEKVEPDFFDDGNLDSRDPQQDLFA